ncbi:MAG: oligosaccharide flippase family protein [Prevotellaceae bacterium]|jgi:O-antigen/teichoic acid export membrane protein|nr:oligosaccharide flippase family protein [Prevotellaceae bacterium]
MSNQSGIKSLAKDTAIYGVSSIVGKFFNWLLVPFYSRVITQAEFGISQQLYAWIALIIVILTYGMETGYFRFASDNSGKWNANKVYTTTLTSILCTSVVFVILFSMFNPQIAFVMRLSDFTPLVMIMGVTVAIDAFSTIPFGYLRFTNKPVKFMIIKLLTIFSNIFFVLFFLWLCPKIYAKNPDLISWFFKPDNKVLYIVIANLLGSLSGLLALLPYIFVKKWEFDFSLLKKMLRYSLPLLLLGVVGIMNQTLDKLLFPYLFNGSQLAMRSELGVYQACFKIAMVMMMFSYAFKFAYEPFVFSQKNKGDNKMLYSLSMKFYVISSLIIFLVLTAYLDVLALLLKESFRSAIMIIPFVLITYLFQGIYFNLSIWYKLSDRTHWGTWISLIGFVLTLVSYRIFIPIYSYWACVFGSLFSFFVMMSVSYLLGQKYFPIKYNLKKIGAYFAFAISLAALMLLVKMPNLWLTILWRSALLVPFLVLVIKKDVPVKEIIARIKKG